MKVFFNEIFVVFMLLGYVFRLWAGAEATLLDFCEHAAIFTVVYLVIMWGFFKWKGVR